MSELTKYKQEAIALLVAERNRVLSQLSSKLNRDLAAIQQNMRLSKYVKVFAISQLRAKYNAQVANIQSTFNQRRAAILALTALPGSATPPPPVAAASSKKSLLIGINYRDTSNELAGCINDANNMNEFLTARSVQNVCLMTDDTTKKPTKQNIVDEFTNLLRYSVSGDFLVFTFSGHGSNIVDRSGDEVDGRDEMIIPYDYNGQIYVLDDELRKIIDTHLKPDVKLLMFFDSCHSGTMLDLKYHYLDSDNYEKTTMNGNVAVTKGQIVTISGCKDSQYSADTIVNLNGKENMSSGAMTYAFLKCIKPSMSFRELLQQMRLLLKSDGYDQVPQLLSGQELNLDEVFWLA
jgi:hypothetical protein